MVNCNPETVSTDYDTSDRLYFEPLTLEDVLEIVDLEKPKGVIVQFGGQTPLKLARALEDAGVPIIGTSPDSIDLAEDRERFQQLRRSSCSSSSRRTAPRATPRKRVAIAQRGRLSARRAAVLRARRPRDGDRLRRGRRSATTWRDAVEACRTTARSCSTASSTSRSRSTSTRSRDGEDVHHRRHHGARRAGRHSLGRLRLLAAAVQPDAPRCRTDAARAGAQMAQGAEGHRHHEHAVRDPERRSIYVLEVNPRARARFRSSRRPPACRSRRSRRKVMAGQSFAEQGVTRRGKRAGYFSVKEAGVPVHQVPGRRPDPRAGDEVRRAR